MATGAALGVLLPVTPGLVYTVPVTATGDGTITLTFSDCSTGVVEYNIPSINRQGTVPIQRVATDNVALCETLSAE